jgi:hypothetical protein
MPHLETQPCLSLLFVPAAGARCPRLPCLRQHSACLSSRCAGLPSVCRHSHAAWTGGTRVLMVITCLWAWTRRAQQPVQQPCQPLSAVRDVRCMSSSCAQVDWHVYSDRPACVLRTKCVLHAPSTWRRRTVLYGAPVVLHMRRVDRSIRNTPCGAAVPTRKRHARPSSSAQRSLSWCAPSRCALCLDAWIRGGLVSGMCSMGCAPQT